MDCRTNVKGISIVLFLAGFVWLTGCQGKTPDVIMAVNDANFDEQVVKNEKPVLVFFYWKKNSRQYDGIFDAMNKFGAMAGDELALAKYCMPDGNMDEKYGLKNDAMCILFKRGTIAKTEGLAEIQSNPSLNAGQLYLVVETIIKPKIPISYKIVRPAYITKKDFDEKVLKAEKPVLVNFTARNKTCSQIHACASDFASAATIYADYADFYYVDFDDSGTMELLDQYNIRAIPSLMTFYKGKEQAKSQKSYPAPYNQAQLFGMILPYIPVE